MKIFTSLKYIEIKEGLIAQYFTKYEGDTHPDELPYKIAFPGGMPFTATSWCADNCKGKWGWIFTDIDFSKQFPNVKNPCRAYLLFEDAEEATHFKLQFDF